MKHLRRGMRKLFGLFTNSRTETEMNREMASHLALLEEEFLRKGMVPAEARRQARISFGGLEQTRIACREERGLPFIEKLWADVRFGWRQLCRNKITSAAAV